jgi:hypothetical protein
MATIYGPQSNDEGVEDEIALAEELAEIYANPDTDSIEFENNAIEFWSTEPEGDDEEDQEG